MIEIQPVRKPINATIEVPGSKSYTNRALLVAAMAHGTSTLTGALFSDDTRYMCNALQKLGVKVDADEKLATFDVYGNGGEIPVSGAELYIGNSGTTSRSLTAYVSLGHGKFVIDGDEPMRHGRPIADLLDALRQIGVSARTQFENGHLPVIVEANGLEGGKTRLDISKSSQFLTALLLIAPYAKNGMEIEVVGKREMPYIDITRSVMAAFGVQVISEGYRFFRIEGGQQYQPRVYNIEPDASNASYFFAAAALTGGRVTVQHLNLDSAQGDLQFVHILEQMGCQTTVSNTEITVTGPRQLKGISVDMRTISDTALTLAAIAPFADSKVTIRNIEHTRWQETDRIHAMVTELRKLGAPVVEHQDGLEISPAPITPAAIDTYEDHRVAMAFSLVGLKADGIRINDPECVSKTFPNYFEVFERLYA
ncbi:3-phosphoshikimate 1-carboxyvinyltransferase [Candidatus Poribacteria bacterium]|nr:3-phosphoshikimate 1-carboxyvinyltransferase [Candidatus Poribacteria bacterium]MYG08359.1 3-phosphoshikimate 1-carboxyvinyltransferase [Candidatus Poribacteria bacterium]MYK24237.1 3-phosphoshikimate 1-carboxyvinyltransferase [Candidatus Poribacteria bacterium]